MCSSDLAQLYIFKKLSIPKRLEVAAQGFFVVVIAFAAEDARFQGVATDPAIADELDALDDAVRYRNGWRLNRRVRKQLVIGIRLRGTRLLRG